MPMNRKLYPENWEEISRDIRFNRAGNCCEWCGVKNHAIGARDIYGNWHDDDEIQGMKSDEGYRLFNDGYPKTIKIILTVAHLGTAKPDGSPGDKHDKMDCRPENLAALCQRCHLNYDRRDHIANRRKTYQKRRIQRYENEQQTNGQLKLSLE